jgi:YfiH family protein
MSRLIFPEIFNNSIKAFFTKKSIGVNIEEICRTFSIKKNDVYLPIQRHTDKVQVVKTDLNPRIADAVLTRRKGILLGVKVADCVPVLFSDTQRSVIGAVHAGWRGTAAQIVKKAIALMIKDFGSSLEDIKLAFGPSIRWSCYHVGHEVKDAIYEATGEGKYYLQRDGKYCIDLASANIYQAISMGIPEENIWVSHECTYCNPREYYSYRYTKILNGSQGGFIGIF